MQILCFAHRLEASAFFNHAPNKSITPYLFKADKYYILITGEGMQSATEHLTEVLATTPEINAVINLGVAAGNPEQTELNHVYPIRTLYRQRADLQMEFRSFTTQNKEAQFDVTSTETRIQSSEDANKIFQFSPILDREAWALASVSKRFKKDFFCFKYISDDATKEACSQIKDIAEEISLTLLNAYLNLPTDKNENTEDLIPKGYHFTFTQKNEYEKLLHKISLKKNISPKQLIASFPTFNAKKPNDKTKLLLTFMQEHLDPFTFNIKQRLNEITAKYKNDSLKVSYDKSLESDDLELNIKFTSADDLANKLRNLDSFPFEKVLDLLRGKNVE
ncbi:MAG: hypothetical protein KDD37_09525 [Bdellovibrionales bacterium]|nr:hypothetical protein [Bdellovibrionales bacterium]